MITGLPRNLQQHIDSVTRRLDRLERQPMRRGIAPSTDTDPVWINDQFTMTRSAPQSFVLTHLPVTKSEDFKVNGAGQLRTVDWTRDGRLLTLIGDGLASGDKVLCHYQWDPDVDDPPATVATPVMVGWSSILGAHSALALPSGTQTNDLLIAGGMPAGSASDGRLTRVGSTPNYARFYDGVASSLGNLAMASSSDFGVSATVALRNAEVIASSFASGSDTVSVPATTGADMVVIFAEGVGSTVHGTVYTNTPGWTQIGISDPSNNLTIIRAWYRLGDSPVTTVINTMASPETYVRTVQIGGAL